MVIGQGSSGGGSDELNKKGIGYLLEIEKTILNKLLMESSHAC